jgi:hypothetical protein
MERIHKLPFILGCLAALAVGIANYITDADNQTIFFRMAIVMTIFFILGVFIRNTILSIKDEVREREIERQRDEEQQLRLEREKQRAAEDNSKYQQAYTGDNHTQQGQTQHKVDLVAEDTAGEFQPMTVSRVISSKVRE